MTTDIKSKGMEWMDRAIIAENRVAELEGQLSAQTAEPVAWLMITPNQKHHIILWDQSEADRYSGMGGRVIQALYTHPPVTQTEQPVVDDLRMLVVRLARALNKAIPDNTLAYKALDYLERKGLQGSPLRAETEQPSLSDARIGEQCVSSSGPIGCYRVRCHLGKVCAAIANRAPK
jgi:hypothetical protein